jgi:succinoglycan biosynthesis protein ExoA
MARVPRKERRDARAADAPNVTVPGVVDAEIVPDDGAARREDAIDLVGEPTGHLFVEDRRQHGEEQHVVEGGVGEGEGFRVAVLETEVVMASARVGDEIGQEIDAAQALGTRAEPDEAREHVAVAAADLQDARAFQRRGPVREERAKPLEPFGDDGAIAGIGRRPSAVRGALAGVAAVDGRDALNLVPRFHRSPPTIPAVETGAMPGETLSVVICTRNRPVALAECIGSLRAQTRPAGEVIVVDGGTARLPARMRRRLRKRLGRTRIRFVATPPGLPRQRNLGATLAHGSVIVFLDDDVVLEPGYLAAIAAVYEDDPMHAIGGVGGAQVPDPTPRESALRRAVCRVFQLESYGAGRLKRSGRPAYLLSPRDECAVQFLSGCNMSFRREVLSEIEFDERLCGYALGEDLDFSYRASKRWTLVATPAARCDHRQAKGGRPETDAFRAMSIFNKYLFFREHVARSPLDWLVYAWATLGGVLIRLRAPGARGMRGVFRGHALIARHLATGALPPEPVRESARAERPARPSVSVVVPARNEEATLGACLASIRAQQPIAGGIEIVVVENGSRDRTRAVAEAVANEDARVRVVASSARNQAEAMNDGILAAHGDVVARVDAHSTIAPDYLRRVLAALARHPRAAGVGGPFQPAGETAMERAIGHARSSPLGVGGGYGADRDGTEHPVRSVQCGAYWREPLLEAGLFDPAMAYGEDEELNWRLLQNGADVVLCPGLRQPYRPRASLGALLEQYWRYGQGRARVLRKHPGFLAARHLVPSAFLIALAALLLGTLVGSARAASGLLFVGGSWLLVLVAAGLLALRSAPASEAARVPLAVACMHLGYGAGVLAGFARFATAGLPGPGPLPLAEPPG